MRFHVHVNRIESVASINIEADNETDALQQALDLAKVGALSFSDNDMNYQFLAQAFQPDDEAIMTEAPALPKSKAKAGHDAEFSPIIHRNERG